MINLKLNNVSGKYIGLMQANSTEVSIQIKGSTTISIEVSVDGETYIPYGDFIEIKDKDIINITSIKFGMMLKIVSTNNVEIKVLA